MEGWGLFCENIHTFAQFIFQNLGCFVSCAIMKRVYNDLISRRCLKQIILPRHQKGEDEMSHSSTKSSRYEMDMCNGPLFSKVLVFALPLVLSGILQLLFNAADIVVVGRFAGSVALAAVGSTSALINLLVNVFIGLSVGTNVMVAHCYGSKLYNELNDVIHTAILTALLGGIALISVGFFLSGPLLRLMGTPEDVIEYSVLYMRIYFAGMPAMMVYNFGGAILRAVGDTKRPLYYLFGAGIINVVLNLIFVIVFHMGVAGVALATVISQVVSAFLVVRCLVKTEGYLKLDLKRLRIVPDKLIKIVRIGLPAGLQGALFSISNVLIQSSINSFGSVVMAGNTAAGNIEGFVYTSMNALHQTAISFTGQNYGAMKFKRIGRLAVICLGIVSVIGLVMGIGAYTFSGTLLQLYSTDPVVISYGVLRMSYVCAPYFLCGLMDVMVGFMRGMGYSILPMIVSLTGACLFRVVWITTIFEHYRTLPVLYISYPISWVLTFLVHFICFMHVYRKLLKRNA